MYCSGPTPGETLETNSYTLLSPHQSDTVGSDRVPPEGGTKDLRRRGESVAGSSTPTSHGSQSDRSPSEVRIFGWVTGTGVEPPAVTTDPTLDEVRQGTFHSDVPPYGPEAGGGLPVYDPDLDGVLCSPLGSEYGHFRLVRGGDGEKKGERKRRVVMRRRVETVEGY